MSPKKIALSALPLRVLVLPPHGRVRSTSGGVARVQMKQTPTKQRRTPVSHNWIAPFVERCGRMLVARNAHFNEVDDVLAQSC